MSRLTRNLKPDHARSMALAASVTTQVQIEHSAALAPAQPMRPTRRRIDRQAGQALEILGHAIEYLTDEYVHEGGSLSGRDARVQAVQLLMALNRQIYFECPEVKSLAERCLSYVRGLRP
jgi:hypothetical protein